VREVRLSLQPFVLPPGADRALADLDFSLSLRPYRSAVCFTMTKCRSKAWTELFSGPDHHISGAVQSRLHPRGHLP